MPSLSMSIVSPEARPWAIIIPSLFDVLTPSTPEYSNDKPFETV